MSRNPAFRLAYTHETAFASRMAQTFAAPAGIPAQMQALLDRLDGLGAEHMDAIRHLSEPEAGDARGAPRPRT